MTQIIRRFIANTQNRNVVRIEKRDNQKDGQLPDITGLAAVFFDENDRAGTQYQLFDNYFERILPGAFDRAVKDDDVRALQNHDPRLLLGRSAAGTLQLEVTKEGLAYRIQPPDTQVGRDTIQLLERKDLDGSSFAFLPESGGVEWTEERQKVDGVEVTLYVRNVKAVELFDVGPVTFPAYLATSAHAGKRSPRMFLDARNDGGEIDSIRAELQAWKRTAQWQPEADARSRFLELASMS